MVRLEIFQSVWLVSNTELNWLNTMLPCRWCMTHWHHLHCFGLCPSSKLKNTTFQKPPFLNFCASSKFKKMTFLEAEAASETSCFFFKFRDGRSPKERRPQNLSDSLHLTAETDSECFIKIKAIVFGVVYLHY